MAVNRGKDFEQVIKDSFLKVHDVGIVRLPDPTQGYLGIRNISDFIVYKYPYQYFIECKSVHGGTLPFSNITDNQWQGMLEMSKITGIIAGIICWYIDYDITVFLPIEFLQEQKSFGRKSIQYGLASQCTFGGIENPIVIPGKKKRVFFDYDMDIFFHTIEKRKR